jgi:hypothetical protein
MVGMNLYDTNPSRQKDNPFGNQSVMPRNTMPTLGATTTYPTPQDMQNPQSQPGLLAGQMRQLAPMAGVQGTPNAMQMQPSMQKQLQQGRQANQPSAMTMQPTTY